MYKPDTKVENRVSQVIPSYLGLRQKQEGYPGTTRTGFYPGDDKGQTGLAQQNQPVVFLGWKNDRLT